MRFANTEASGATGAGAEGVAESEAAGMGDPKVEMGVSAGDVPKTEVDDELAPNMTEGKGLTPKLLVSHSIVPSTAVVGAEARKVLRVLRLLVGRHVERPLPRHRHSAQH